MNAPKYLEKYAFQAPVIQEKPSLELNQIVVIPCFDEPDLWSSLRSLYNCDATKGAVEVIVVLNQSENAGELDNNQKVLAQFPQWKAEHDSDLKKFHLISALNLPKKHAGVGLARKIGMDEAVYRFHLSGKEDGIITCFDADSGCLSNYLTAVEAHFEQYPKTPGCSVYFEHPLTGEDYPNENYEAIYDYELFLRYYRQGLLYAQHPVAFHTIGSSMAVRTSAYCKQGGMNRRKAGEDFYFLQKIIALGGFTDLITISVIPSPRVSHRVPFGTGKAVGDAISLNQETEGYAPQVFEDIRLFLTTIDGLYEGEEMVGDWPESIIAFLKESDWEQALLHMRKQSTNLKTFRKHFFHWFDGFKVLKLVHFVRDHFYPNRAIKVVGAELLQMMGEEVGQKGLLATYRKLDRRGNNPD
ncbi:MAG: family 2 glycosyl transferase [Crocinitomicaceae bacterium]|nr:family 2 glycosyl transferase [Crocinitomicaceae bacterium]